MVLVGRSTVMISFNFLFFSLSLKNACLKVVPDRLRSRDPCSPSITPIHHFLYWYIIVCTRSVLQGRRKVLLGLFDGVV